MVSDPGSLPRGSGTYFGITVSGEQRQFIASGVGQELTSNAIYEALQGSGLGGNRQAILAAIREERGSRGNAPGLQLTPSGFVPSEGVYYPVSYNLGSAYMVRAYLQAGTDAAGNPLLVHAAFRFNEPLIQREVVAGLLEIMTPRLCSLGLCDENGNPLVSSEGVTFTHAVRQG